MAFLISEKKWFIRDKSFQLSDQPAQCINLSMLLKPLYSYLKEFSPKPSTVMVSVFLCCNVSGPCPAQTASLDSDWHYRQFSKGCGLTNFVMFCSQTNQCLQYQWAFFCTEMCIPNTTKAVFLYTDYFIFNFSRILLILVTVRCTYWGLLWWRDSLL